MAGHSQFANIKHRKGAVDKKRARVFSTHAKAIMTAARLGGADPKMNARLALAIEKARADNLPKDNIERAIKKGTGTLEGAAALEDVRYEATLPGGIAILIDCVTDNRNRTAPEVRSLFDSNGGRLAETGSVAWMFDSRSLVTVKAGGVDEVQLTEAILDLGAEDLKREGDEFRILGEPTALAKLTNGLKAAGYDIQKSAHVMLPKNPITLDVEAASKVLDVIDALEEHEDVNDWHGNFEIPPAVIEQLEKAG
jgi:YebC/PmpR family DNA-binding regulatory protein